MPRIERVPLNMQNLGDLLDGKIDAMLMVHLKRAAVDCMDRPGEKKPRRVTFQIEVVPICEDQGYADRVDCAVSCKSKFPEHISTPIQLELNPQGFLFNKNVPDYLDQHSMHEVDGFDPEASTVAAPGGDGDDDDPDDDPDDVDDDHPDAGTEYDDGENC